MGFLKKLVKGDWSNPFDNIKSGAKNFVEQSWNSPFDWAGLDKSGPDILKGLALYGAGNLAGGSSMLPKGLDWGDIFSVGADMLGTYWANEQSAQSVRDQMRFQERMSSTSHQRAVQDLYAAGLNPMLVALNGASSPSGASYQARAAQPGASYQQAASARAARELNTVQMDVGRSQEAANRASAGASSAQAAKAHAEQMQTEEWTRRIPQMVDEIVSRTNLNRTNSGKAAAEERNLTIDARTKEKTATEADVKDTWWNWAKRISDDINKALEERMTPPGYEGQPGYIRPDQLTRPQR